jgi:hypothetical protein
LSLDIIADLVAEIDAGVKVGRKELAQEIKTRLKEWIDGNKLRVRTSVTIALGAGESGGCAFVDKVRHGSRVYTTVSGIVTRVIALLGELLIKYGETDDDIERWIHGLYVYVPKRRRRGKAREKNSRN